MLDSSAVSAAGGIRSFPGLVEGGKSFSKRRSTGCGQDKQITEEQKKMFQAAEELNAATCSIQFLRLLSNSHGRVTALSRT